MKSTREDNKIAEDEQGGDVGRGNGRREAKIGRMDGRKPKRAKGWRHEG